jgi:hypothetical protein
MVSGISSMLNAQSSMLSAQLGFRFALAALKYRDVVVATAVGSTRFEYQCATLS